MLISNVNPAPPGHHVNVRMVLEIVQQHEQLFRRGHIVIIDEQHKVRLRIFSHYH